MSAFVIFSYALASAVCFLVIALILRAAFRPEQDLPRSGVQTSRCAWRREVLSEQDLDSYRD